MTKYKYIEVIKYWKSLNIKTSDDLKNSLESFSVLFAYNSCAIENKEVTYCDTKEIFENSRVVNFTGKVKTLFEISNQKDCYNYLTNIIFYKNMISEKFIKHIHLILTKNTYENKNETPGEYKKHHYVTGKNEVGAAPSDVHDEISNLINDINSVKPKNDEDIIRMAAYFHNVFEEIHPFADGNGRVGRCFVNYILITNGLPPIIIYDEDKKYYYAALEKFDSEDNLDSMVEFFKYEMEKTWERKIDISRGINKKIVKFSDIKDSKLAS